MGRKPGAEGLSNSTSYEPYLYFILKPEVCENHGSDITHLYTNPKTGVVTLQTPKSLLCSKDH